MTVADLARLCFRRPGLPVFVALCIVALCWASSVSAVVVGLAVLVMTATRIVLAFGRDVPTP